MIIDGKQIFWKMNYCYALIPIVQLLDGRNYLIKFRCIDNNQKTSVIVYPVIASISIRFGINDSFHIKITIIVLQFKFNHSTYSKRIIIIINKTLNDSYNPKKSK
jgi:hypothetical protein